MTIEDPMTGCRGCASGSGGENNIFGNKYGQYLASIQIAREQREDRENSEEVEDNEKEVQANEYRGPVGAADGSSGIKASVWANENENIELPEELLGVLSEDAERESRMASKRLGGNVDTLSGPPGKRSRG